MKRLPFCGLALLLLPVPARADPAPEPRVWIHVESPTPVRLERMAPGDVEWGAVCHSPCDTFVRTDGVYRVAGEAVRPSPSFFIHARPGGRVDVRIRPSSTTTHALGILGVIGGSVVAGTALTVAFGQWLAGAFQNIGSSIGALPCAVRSPCGTPPAAASPNLTPALLTAAFAGVVAVAGAMTLVADGHTVVEGEHVERAPEPPTPPSDWLPPDDIAPPIVAAGVGLRLRF